MDMLFSFLFSAAIMVPTWIYLFFSAKRGVELIFKDKTKKVKIIISLVISSCIMIPALNMWKTLGTWSIVVFHLCAITILTQFINFIITKVASGRKNKVWEYVYRLSLIPILCTALICTYGYINIKKVVETSYSISTDKIVSKDGYKVALLSDIHFGTANDNDSIQKIVDEISQKELDMIFLTGDIVDEKTTLLQMEQLFHILGKAKSKYGTYYVYGNHDTSPYTKSPNYTKEQLVSSIEGNGITILDDKVKEITDDLVLVGRKDGDGERMSIDELMDNVDKNKYVIVLDHQPHEFKEKDESGVDLQLSGHTHGGQIFPSGFLMRLLNLGDLDYGKKVVGDMTAIVTSGVSGGDYPIRTESKSEYVIININ